MQEHGLYGSESMTWRVASEAALTLGGSRAILMQLAHPLVAAGVSAHSRYMHDPFGRAESTFLLGQMLTFGSTRMVRQAAQRINRLHTHVHGTLPLRAGVYTHGATYDARDPELLLWVHATLIDTILLSYPLFFRPLSLAEQEQYYQESKSMVRLLGLSARAMPATVQDLRDYVHTMVYNNHLAATPQARQLARVVLFPPASWTLHPLLHFNLLLTCGLLPQPVRELYDLHWDDKRQHVFELATAGLRATLPHLPPSLRVLPVTRRLMQTGTLTP